MKLNIDNFINENEIKSLFKSLYKIPNRSIMGVGFRKSLSIIGKKVDLNIKTIKSGKKVLDWIVPDEWNINDGYIVSPSGKKIADFKKHSLHIMNYSIPIKKKVSLKELKKHLYTLPELPDAIPYVHSYYERKWGFALSHNEFLKLKDGEYEVFIDSEIKPGKLVYSDTLIKGKSKKEVLLSTYLCHPQTANHELSGPIVWSTLYNIIKNTGPHYYSYRFLICPENIGAAAFLHNSKKNFKKIVAGYIINCVGHGKEVTYKKSRAGDTLSDQAALNVICNSNYNFKVVDFEPDGSDERQFCSPGFNMPIGLIMRKMYGTFNEYHNSLDDENFISFKTIMESIKLYNDVLCTIDKNFIPIAKIKHGTPQLSRYSKNLYPNTMQFNSFNIQNENRRFLLETLNLSDGNMNFLEICQKKNFKFIDYLQIVKKLLDCKLIKTK